MSRNKMDVGGGDGASSFEDASSSLIRKDDYHRPRRPDPDTIHYLRSLPLEVSLAHEEIQTFLLLQQQQQHQKGKLDDDAEIEYPSSLAACLSAIDEIKNEIASLAGDEHGATGIETLARIALPYSELAARKLLYYACCSPGMTGGATTIMSSNHHHHHHQKEVISGSITTVSSSTNLRQSYAVHLALHRYGSHVLQTLLSLCICNHINICNNSNSNNKDLDLAQHEHGPGLSGGGFVTPDELEMLPSLSELLLQLQQDLSPHAVQLSVHMCGSHVLRALVCALGGVQVVDTRGVGRGGGGDFLDQQQQQQHGGGGGKTNKKKKKKGKGAASSAGGGGGGGGGGSDSMQMFFVSNSRIPSPRKNANIRQALLQLTHAITGGSAGSTEAIRPPGKLQQRACHASAAPVLILLLRVLTYVDANEEWKNKLLLPSTTSTTTSSSPSSSFANHHLCLMRQEPHFENGSAAHALAKQLLCWSSSDDDDDSVDDNVNDNNTKKKVGGKWASDVIYGLSGEARGSHVLDALFRLSPNDFYQSILEAGDFSSTPTLKEYIEHDVSNFVVQTLLATIRTAHQAETMVQALAPIVSSGLVIQVAKRRRGILWRLAEMAANHNVGQVQIMQSLQDGLTAIQEATAVVGEGTSSSNNRNLEDCAARVLLDMKRPDSTDTGRLGLNVEGTRALYHLLRFKPRLCKPVVNSIIALSPSDLELLAKDGLGSRCVWDAILEWPATTKNTMQAKVLRKLLDKLNGRWASLATDRIGHHVVRKVFRCLGDMNDRENLVKELVKGIHRLRANAMGRSILEACAVEEYGTGDYAEWRKIIKKKMEKDEWLQEIVHKSSIGDAFSTNEKKRHHSESETSKRSKKSKGESSAVNVDSIMEAMSIPTSAKNKKKS